jgi:hypothetical protein
MKRMALNLSLLLVASVFLLSACTRREMPSDPNVGTPSAAATTSSPVASGQPQSQPSAQPSVSATATKSGWWIRINPSLTTAEAITLQIGTGKLQREEWRVWRAGEPAEFDVPEKYSQAPRLYVRGSVTPIGKVASLCMMYKDRGVEHLSFDDDDSETKSQAEVDPKCR